MVGFILSWCGLLLEWVVRMFLSLRDLAKVLKLLSIVSCASVGGVCDKLVGYRHVTIAVRQYFPYLPRLRAFLLI